MAEQRNGARHRKLNLVASERALHSDAETLAVSCELPPRGDTLQRGNLCVVLWW